jgi:N6-L-threonylcarbamoyladenine synthase
MSRPRLLPTPFLAIDTSCDDTAAAVTAGPVILSNVVASQVALHQPYGGVFPTVAKATHREWLPEVVEQALSESGIKWSELAGIAVTQGPGLAPSLEVGLEIAQQLGAQHHLKVWGVNHLAGHLWSVFGTYPGKSSPEDPAFPALGMIISGKHSDLILITAAGKYQRLGWTLDDAAGEALDKVGRLAGLEYPAGGTIEELARKGSPARFPFPLPMTEYKDGRMSFAGLKTAAANLAKKHWPNSHPEAQDLADFCASFQHAVFRHIFYKLKWVLGSQPEVKEIWLGGGVAANQLLREQLGSLCSEHSLTLRLPARGLSGDNAAMIGIAAWAEGIIQQPATKTLDRKPIWPLGI